MHRKPTRNPCKKVRAQTTKAGHGGGGGVLSWCWPLCQNWGQMTDPRSRVVQGIMITVCSLVPNRLGYTAVLAKNACWEPGLHQSRVQFTHWLWLAKVSVWALPLGGAKLQSPAGWPQEFTLRGQWWFWMSATVTDQGPEKEGSEQRVATSLNKCFAPEWKPLYRDTWDLRCEKGAL